MKLYRLDIGRGEYEPEGVDHCEWFASLRAARRRRAVLLHREREEAREFDAKARRKHGPDFVPWEPFWKSEYQIDRVTLARLPPLKMAAALLNGCGLGGQETVVQPRVWEAS